MAHGADPKADPSRTGYYYFFTYFFTAFGPTSAP